jgi:saccharopine dehydrogenase (NADP+, L-glutamate forming)
MLEEKMRLQEWERDIVFMQNEFKLLSKDGKVSNKKYDLVVFGRHNGLPYSAVSLLVSMPCAITAQLILDGRLRERGVLRPTSDVVISTVLEEVRILIYGFFKILDEKRENICRGAYGNES